MAGRLGRAEARVVLSTRQGGGREVRPLLERPIGWATTGGVALGDPYRMGHKRRFGSIGGPSDGA